MPEPDSEILGVEGVVFEEEITRKVSFNAVSSMMDAIFEAIVNGLA